MLTFKPPCSARENSIFPACNSIIFLQIDSDIAPMFKNAPDNCYFDKVWEQYLINSKVWVHIVTGKQIGRAHV